MSPIQTAAALPLIPENELERLAAVRRYEILDTPPDGTFDRITAMAARLFDVPIAIVSIVDHDRIWFRSHHGLDATEIGRDPGLCASAILQDGVYVLEDAAVDLRSLSNPLVAGEMGLRFYAAAPLRTPDGFNLGTLCVLDTEPREVTLAETETLQDLAGVVMDEMELRRRARELHRREEHLLREATELAGTLQRSLLPGTIPSVAGFELAATFHPADPREVSGDFYDIFRVRDGVWGIAVGDVAGKGPAAAAATALVRYSLRTAALDAPSPQEAFEVVNSAMLASDFFGPDHDFGYCTVAFAYLEETEPGADSAPITIARAGHVRPIIVRATGEVVTTRADGQPLGLLEHPRLTPEPIDLGRGEALVLYTDGLSEARFADGRYGDARLRSVLAEVAGRGADAIVARIRSLVEELQHGIDDDVALLVVSRPS